MTGARDFAWKLAKAGQAPASRPRAVGVSLVGAALVAFFMFGLLARIPLFAPPPPRLE